VISFTAGANGTTAVNADRTITYTPKTAFSGNDSFNYTITDGHGETATASVGILVIAQALNAVDSDNDGMSDANELWAGTDPNDASSVLKAAIASGPSSEFSLKWPSVEGRKYRVMKCTDILSGDWVVVASGLTAQPPANEITVPQTGEQAFYRIELED